MGAGIGGRDGRARTRLAEMEEHGWRGRDRDCMDRQKSMEG